MRRVDVIISYLQRQSCYTRAAERCEFLGLDFAPYILVVQAQYKKGLQVDGSNPSA